jgi:hypothetical protein
MKITPIASGGANGQNMGQITTGFTGQDRLASAKAIAAGKQYVPPVDREAERAQASIRKIKMRTNVSPDRIEQAQTIQDPAIEESGVISDATETEQATSEETRPLSPQFAALAKQRRAIQVKEMELKKREDALAAGSNDQGLSTRLKSEPLSVLQEQGILNDQFYTQLTDLILSGQSGINPDIQKLQAEIKALKEGVDKTLTDRDSQAEKQALDEMMREASFLSKDGDAFEMIRETKSLPDVRDLIHRTYKQTGEVLDVSDAMNLVETELLNESLKIANLSKIKNKLIPQQPLSQTPTQRNTIRTLTNRDSSLPNLDRRARAIAAMNGTLKR